MLNDIDILRQKLIFYTLWKKVDVKSAFLYEVYKKFYSTYVHEMGIPNCLGIFQICF